VPCAVDLLILHETSIVNFRNELDDEREIEGEQEADVSTKKRKSKRIEEKQNKKTKFEENWKEKISDVNGDSDIPEESEMEY